MKLSEAISLGSMLCPQAFGKFVDEEGGRCALGTAMAAFGSSKEWGARQPAGRRSVAPTEAKPEETLSTTSAQY
jgi:hypothetical protein